TNEAVMRFWDFFNPLVGFQQQLNRIEGRLSKMATFDEVKQLFADAFRENNETIAAAVKRIEELIAGQADPTALENLAAQLREQIKSNEDFQASVAPPTPTP